MGRESLSVDLVQQAAGLSNKVSNMANLVVDLCPRTHGISWAPTDQLLACRVPGRLSERNRLDLWGHRRRRLHSGGGPPASFLASATTTTRMSALMAEILREP